MSSAKYLRLTAANSRRILNPQPVQKTRNLSCCVPHYQSQQQGEKQTHFGYKTVTEEEKKNKGERAPIFSFLYSTGLNDE